MPDDQIGQIHLSGNAETFGRHTPDSWRMDGFSSPAHEWVYTTSVQNDDDLFLSIPLPSPKRKTQHLQQLKERCRSAIDKLIHAHK